MNPQIINLKYYPESMEEAAQWFADKWSVPFELYLTSMAEALFTKNSIPSWYVAIDDGKIVAGLGVIDNDFHDRPDLTPNLCALYVEKEYRGQELGADLLYTVVDDLNQNDIEDIYLITDHDNYYERYGWEHIDMVKSLSDGKESKIYQYKG